MPEHAESNKPPGPASAIRKCHNVADVVIASGGPNGLMRACELGLAGIRPVLPEQSPGPNTQRRAAGIVCQECGYSTTAACTFLRALEALRR
ncbi:hypothetical protein AO501_32605 [Mycobacterium gordonae]|uniref:FAD-binding domain-containing protein n=1 Tax=Mycobacterium gordonae TaxID=1778 RepID=A0A0Q2QUQ9_MYCGO|nr:hypothetical protein AO501_32605 [Mycobacterium gordonae]